MKRTILVFTICIFVSSPLFTQEAHFYENSQELFDYYSKPTKVVMTIWSNHFNNNNTRSCQVFGFEHSIYANSMQNAEVNQKEFLLIKRINKLSPYLNEFLSENTTLPRVRITFFTQGPDGQEFQYYSIIFEDVKIIMTKNFLSDIRKYNPEKRVWHWEQLNFRYRKVTWRHDETGYSYSQ